MTQHECSDEATPLTPDEFEDLKRFFAQHHPPIYEEIQRMERDGLVSELPILFRLYYNEMQLYRAGKPTRHLEFL